MCRMWKPYLSAAIIWFAAAGLVGQARAQIIIGNLVGGSPDSGYDVGSPASGLNQSMSVGFTMTSSYVLTDAQLLLNIRTGTLGLALYADDGHNEAGTLLMTFTNPTFGSGLGTYTFTPSVPTTLLAGTKYWLDLYGTGTTVNQYDLWAGSSSGTPSGPGATDYGQERNLSGNPPTSSGSDTFVRTGYELDGVTPIPEPSTITMVGMGVASMIGYGWRRRKPA